MCVACNRVCPGTIEALNRRLIHTCKPHRYDVQRPGSIWSSYMPLGLDCLCTHTRAGPGLSRLRRLFRLQDGQMHLLAFLMHDPGFDSHGQGHHSIHRVTRVPICLRASYGAIPPRSAGHASGIGSKASIGRDLCNDTRCRPQPLSITWYMYFARHAGSLSLSGIISGRDTYCRRRSHYVIIPYAHDLS
ncbi:hypothetical protein GGI42DRAFT_243216 [Trichoderma sp. SZMC 28013]